MLVLLFALALTAVLITTLEFRRRLGAASLGSMSPQWVAAFRASQQASSG